MNRFSTDVGDFFIPPLSPPHTNTHTYNFKDNMILAKLHFFDSVADVLNPFLTCCQTISPMVPFLYDNLRLLVCKIALLVY